MVRRKFIFAFLMIASLFFSIQPALAGSNALTKYEYIEDESAGFFDLVVSLDWDPTAEQITGMLREAFSRFAQDIFMMSEGRHRIRNLNIFTNGRQMNTADIRISNAAGRSSSYVNGIFQNGARILAYTLYEDQTARSGEALGHGLAHEFAHYAYGLYDEYADSTASPDAPLSQPWPGDTPKETLMNNQNQWQWFSTLADYVKPEERKTAQWRVYQSSAWETLVNDPNNDPTYEEWTAAYPRTRYDDFAGMKAPSELAVPTEGWDSDFRVIYKRGNVAVLVIDRSGSMAETPEGSPTPAMDLAKSAAQQFVDLMNPEDRIAVVDFSNTAATSIQVTRLIAENDRTRVKRSIEVLTPNGQTNFSAALNQAMTVLATGSTIEDNRYVVMMSDGDYNRGGDPNLQGFIQNEIPIYTIGLNVNDSGEAHLQDIAEQTGGTYRAAPTALDLADLYAEINRDILGTTVVLDNQSAQLAQTQVDDMITVVSDQESVVTFRASWEEGDNMAFTLRQPDGVEIGPGSMPVGATYQGASDYGIYTIRNPMPGEWHSILTATAVAASGQVTQEAAGDSPLSIQLDLKGGNFPEPIAIMATITGPEPVIGANVVATITLPEGSQSADPVEVTLRDDGISPDLMKNDGIYSGAYANYPADGGYTISVDADNSAGTAALDNSGALEAGKDAPPEPLTGNFSRHIEGSVTVTGYSPMPTDAAAAGETELNNAKNWGVINSPGAQVWYRFTAEAGQQYFISTSNLLSWDGSPLKTRLMLYDTDHATELANSANYENSDLSMIKWTAPSSADYYIAVSAEGSGTGNFALTIGNVDIVTPTIVAAEEQRGGGDAEGDGDGDGGKSGGCFIESLSFRF